MVILSQFGLKNHVQLALLDHFRLTARAMPEENEEEREEEEKRKKDEAQGEREKDKESEAETEKEDEDAETEDMPRKRRRCQEEEEDEEGVCGVSTPRATSGLSKYEICHPSDESEGMDVKKKRLIKKKSESDDSTISWGKG